MPLRFNKLDLRDYLYHLYGVEVLAVRSWLVQKQPVRQYVNDDHDLPPQGRWHRPQPEKRMTVELVKPFVFPPPPEDRSPWDGLMHDHLQSDMDANTKRREQAKANKYPLPGDDIVHTARVLLAREARKLAIGEKKWTNDVELDERWTDADRGTQGKQEAR